MLLQHFRPLTDAVDDAGNSEDATGLVIVKLQSEIILGEGVLIGLPLSLSSSAFPVVAATVGQRQRHIRLHARFRRYRIAASSAALRMQGESIFEGMEMPEQEFKTLDHARHFS